MYNVYHELWIVREHELNHTIEIELSKRIKKDVEQFLQEKYGKTIVDVCPEYDEISSRATLINNVRFFDIFIGGNGDGKLQQEFEKFCDRKGEE